MSAANEGHLQRLVGHLEEAFAQRVAAEHPVQRFVGRPTPEKGEEVDRIAIAKAGVRRCFERRHEGRYAFMPYADAVRHCRKWICCLRELENEDRRV